MLHSSTDILDVRNLTVEECVMGRKRKRKIFVCQQCQAEFEATVCASGLCKECRKNKHGDSPKCACGCGGDVAWAYGKNGGWRKYIQGHHLKDPSRANPGLKKGYISWNKGNVAYTFFCALQSCQREFQTSDKNRKYCSRECANQAKIGFEPWHKGLTKRDDPRLVKLGESVSAARLEKPPHNQGKTKEDYEPLAKAGESISVVLKEKYASGELENWNAGLTRDDPRWNAACENISATKAHQIGEGEVVPRWFKYSRVGWMTNVVTGEKELFRSSYEAAYMDRLNREGVRWTTKHGIIVRWYDSDGFEHRYVPDFQVWLSEEVFEIHEIKSAYMEKDQDNQRKFQAAIRKGWRESWEFRVLTEDTNPEFVDFDPQSSEWFQGYDPKTLNMLGMNG